MSHKRKGQLADCPEWRKHLRPAFRRLFWKRERLAEKHEISREFEAARPPNSQANRNDHHRAGTRFPRDQNCGEATNATLLPVRLINCLFHMHLLHYSKSTKQYLTVTVPFRQIWPCINSIVFKSRQKMDMKMKHRLLSRPATCV